jgi:hypothetical protein
VKKKPAKKRVSGAIKPASNKAPNNIVRLKAKRRDTGGPKPKLK